MASKLTIQEFNEKYKYIKDLGSGTFGQVFMYEELQGNRKVAVKQIKCENFENLSTSIQELIILCKATHANIIKIYNYLMMKEEKQALGGRKQDEYLLYILMELADYSLDFEIMERFKVNHYYSNKSLFYLIYDITSALRYMQKEKIAHRDIKPHNILKLNGIYKLTDFGVSKVDFSTISQKTISGTPPYLSPILKESFDKRIKLVAHNAYKSDVFSLGLVILCAATLKDVSGLNSNEKEKEKQINQLEKENRYYPWIVEALRNMLTFNEEERWDFHQLYQFLKSVKQEPEKNGILNSQSDTSSTDKQRQNSAKNDQDLNVNSPSIADSDSHSIEQKTQEIYNHRQNSTINVKLFVSADELSTQCSDQKQLQKGQNEEFKKEDNYNVLQKGQSQESPQKNEGEIQKSITNNNSSNKKKTTSNKSYQGNTLVSNSAIKKFQVQVEEFLKQDNRITLSDGSFYVGELDNQLREGYGECYFQNYGLLYKGNWKSDMRDGKGIGMWDNGSKYDGSWKANNRNGYGKMYYNNGDTYEGWYLDDQKHGEGILCFSNQEFYEGEYAYGKREGKGQYTYNDGSTYDGEWKNDKRDGKGCLKIQGKIIYKGDWKANQKDGYGILQITDKTIYEGNFKNDQPHGDGKIYKNNKETEFQVVKYVDGKKITN